MVSGSSPPIILALQGIIFAPAIAKVFWTAIALIQEISSTLWFRAKMRMVPQRWSVRLWRQHGSVVCEVGCRTSMEGLCPVCKGIVHASPLLSGRLRWPIVSSAEIYMHHDWKELKKSANSCALCCLLRSSIKPQELETLDQQATLAIWTSESCIVQIRETRSIEEGTEIKLWLQGDNFRSRTSFS
jgi:hypothetical protein